MAFVLTLKDSTNTVDFMGTDFHLADAGLKISPPAKKQVWGGNSVYANGAQLVASSFENREINITFQVTGATRDALADNITTVERILESARTRSIEQIGSRAELQYQWDGATSVSYFEIIDGELTWPEDVMSVEQVHQRTATSRYILFNFQLKLIAAPFAYNISPVSGSPVAATISNGNGSNNTGLVVWNHDDAGTGHDNYVNIAAAQIDGNYPAKIQLSLQANSGEAELTSKVYVGVRKGTISADLKTLLDSAEGSLISGGTTTSDATNSVGGSYAVLPFSGTDEQTLISWTLTAAQVQATQGPFRFFGRAAPTTHWDNAANYRIRILYGTSSLYESEWRKPLDTTTELLDFGTLYLPPWLVGTPTSLAALTIELRGKRDAAGTTTLNLDYMALLPQDGGYRVMQFRAAGMVQGEYLIDDGWTDSVFHVNNSSLKTGLPFGLMPRLTLVPNRDQRIYFLMEGASQNAEITRQLLVKVSVIPAFNVLS